MKENEHDARLAKAAMKSLRVQAPASLTADLKRLARDRKQAPSFWTAWREALSGRAWAYGAGAFAAAAVGFVLARPAVERSAAPAPAPAAGAETRPAQRLEAVAPQALRDLWADDDGGDNDES